MCLAQGDNCCDPKVVVVFVVGCGTDSPTPAPFVHLCVCLPPPPHLSTHTQVAKDRANGWSDAARGWSVLAEQPAVLYELFNTEPAIARWVGGLVAE